MTKSDKGSEVIAILNKVTFEQRLEVRKERMRTFVESLFLVVEGQVGQCGRSRMMTRTMTEAAPPGRNLQARGRTWDFILREIGGSHWRVLSSDVARPRFLKGLLWLTVWRKEYLGARVGAGRLVRRRLGKSRQGILVDRIRREMEGYGVAAFSTSCQDLLTDERKVDDSKVFGLADWKNELAIYGDGGRLGEEQVWGWILGICYAAC